MFTRLIEIGRVISTKNEKALRAALEAITNVLAALETEDATEAERSASDKQKLLRVAIKDKLEAAASGVEIWCYIADVFDTYFVYEAGGSYYQADYTIDESGNVAIGDATEVYPRVVYEPVGGGEQMAEKKMDKNVGGGVDRDKIPAADFAGKNRSFPIVTPKDVKDAVASMGRAGTGNYSTAELKRRIIAICKRKGKSFMDALPKSWRDEMGMGEAAIEADLVGDCVPLVEGADLREATAQLKIIQPGWGSSGYYPPAVLRRDGPSVFSSGTKMFWDHQTTAEEAARPEGSLDRLAAELVEDAAYRDDGPAGPGLYARAKVFDRFATAVGELAPHIGVSIRASGVTKSGEAEGRRGPIIERIVSGKSIDFVTSPGAGGQILQLFESAGRGQLAPTNTAAVGRHEQESTMTEAEIKALQEGKAASDADNARLREALLLRDAREFVTRKLAGINMPDLTRSRLAEQLAASPVVKDGQLDEAAYTTRIDEAVRAEVEYLAKVTGSGRVTGMGSGGSGGGDNTAPSEDDMTKAFQSLGLSESAAKIAARGR